MMPAAAAAELEGISPTAKALLAASISLQAFRGSGKIGVSNDQLLIMH